MLTHANLDRQCPTDPPLCRRSRAGQGADLGILPLFHVFAMTAMMNLGDRHRLRDDPDAEVRRGRRGRLLRRKRPTILPGVPTLFAALLQYPRHASQRSQSLEFCISGGASLPLGLRDRFKQFSGCRLIEGYGLSETSPVVHLTR